MRKQYFATSCSSIVVVLEHDVHIIRSLILHALVGAMYYPMIHIIEVANRVSSKWGKHSMITLWTVTEEMNSSHPEFRH